MEWQLRNVSSMTACAVVSDKDGKNHNLMLFSDVIWNRLMILMGTTWNKNSCKLKRWSFTWTIGTLSTQPRSCSTLATLLPPFIFGLQVTWMYFQHSSYTFNLNYLHLGPLSLFLLVWLATLYLLPFNHPFKLPLHCSTLVMCSLRLAQSTASN